MPEPENEKKKDETAKRLELDIGAELAQLEFHYKKRERMVFMLAMIIALLAIAVCVMAVVKMPPPQAGA